MVRSKGIGSPVGKVTWAKGAYAAMQGLPAERSFQERSMVRDFAAAICRQEGRRIVTGADVTAAYEAMFGKGEDVGT